MIKQAIFLFCFLGSLSALSAQDYYFSLSYNTSAPLADTKEYIDNFSWRGISAEGQWFLSSEASAGFFVGWNVFDQKLSGTFVDGTRTGTGTQIRYINTFPILLEGHYYLGEPDALRPYAGFGLGTYRTSQRTEMGILAVNNNNWQFGFAPSVGMLVPLNNNANLNIAIRYNYAVETNDAINQSYLGINLGVAWMD